MIEGAERIRRKAEFGGDRASLLEELATTEREFRTERRRDYFRSPLRTEAAEALRASRRTLVKDAPALRIAKRSGGGRLMMWATRRGCHVDRTACVWLIRRFIDGRAVFSFFEDLAEAPEGAELFDVAGATLSHHGDDCSFETFLKDYSLEDPALAEISEIVHDADLMDDKYGRPESDGLDAIIRGMQLVLPDDLTRHTDAVFDGPYACLSREVL